MKLEGSDYDAMHDVIFDAYSFVWGNKEFQPDTITVNSWYNRLPWQIKTIGEEWGMNDTVFRDKAFEWIEGELILDKNDRDETVELHQDTGPAIVPSVLFDQEISNSIDWKSYYGF